MSGIWSMDLPSVCRISNATNHTHTFFRTSQPTPNTYKSAHPHHRTARSRVYTFTLLHPCYTAATMSSSWEDHTVSIPRPPNRTPTEGKKMSNRQCSCILASCQDTDHMTTPKRGSTLHKVRRSIYLGHERCYHNANLTEAASSESGRWQLRWSLL